MYVSLENVVFEGNRSHVGFYRIYVTMFWLFVDYRGVAPADCPELVLLNALIWSTAAIWSWNFTQRNQTGTRILDSSRAPVAPLRWIRVTQALGTKIGLERQSWKTTAHACCLAALSRFRSFDQWKFTALITFFLRVIPWRLSLSSTSSLAFIPHGNWRILRTNAVNGKSLKYWTYFEEMLTV